MLASAPRSAAMTLFVLVVSVQRLLALARRAMRPTCRRRAAWVLGVFATAAGGIRPGRAFRLLAATAFGVWAGLVLALGRLCRPAARRVAWYGGAELVGLLLCAAATVFWCRELAAGAAGSGARRRADDLDRPVHSRRVISQFGDPRAAGRQADRACRHGRMPSTTTLSYMLPARVRVAARSARADARDFALGAGRLLHRVRGAYALGAALAGPPRRRGGARRADAAARCRRATACTIARSATTGTCWPCPARAYGVGVALLSLAFLQSLGGSAQRARAARRRRPSRRFRAHPGARLPACAAGLAGERGHAGAVERAAKARAVGGRRRGVRPVRGRLLLDPSGRGACASPLPRDHAPAPLPDRLPACRTTMLGGLLLVFRLRSVPS